MTAIPWIVRENQPHTHRSRGNATVKKREMKPNQSGKIMETYRYGNSVVHICDGYFAETPEEVEQVLDEHHAAGWAIINKMKQYV
ncbi:hypothetical protein [Paenibacillus chitinolyticus]|uniref:hypothetical protein n=1 Tax=Paenibacillus chitinolyticus TaxID=79263 RepID=UPI0036702DFB